MSDINFVSGVGEKRKFPEEDIPHSKIECEFEPEEKMQCSLSKVFWLQLKQSPECQGKIEAVNQISDEEVKLALNRLTPCSPPTTVLSGMNICLEHRVWLSYRNPVAKRTSCSILRCENRGGSRRVTFQLSQSIFLILKEHVLVGSAICESHRKKISAACKDLKVPKEEEELAKCIEEPHDKVDKETQTEGENVKNYRESAKVAQQNIACQSAIMREDSSSSEVTIGSSQSQGLGSDSDMVQINNNSVATAVLLDFSDYLNLAKKDKSRNGFVQRSFLFEALVGRNVREGRFINDLKNQLQMNGNQLYKAAKTRQQCEEKQTLMTFIARIRRKSPEGEGYVSPECISVAIEFMEREDVSDVVKGHHCVLREKVRTDSGDLVLFRQKRILKLTPLQLYEFAQKEINWGFSIRTLLRTMPPWIRHPRQRYMLGCLCTQCTNLSLKLKALVQLLSSLKFGSASEKVIAGNLVLSESITDLLSRILHPIRSEKEWHDISCYQQMCNDNKCGRTALNSLLSPLTTKVPGRQVKVLEHVKTEYKKPDGKLASKSEQVVKEISVLGLVQSLEKQIFGDGSKKETFLEHDLKKKLASKARQNLRVNLKDNEAIANTDFSKELEIIQPETTKDEGFGASHKTFKVVPTVWEMTVLQPGPVRNLHMASDTELFFLPPEENGGSHISVYEVHIKSEDSTWYLLTSIAVQYLSDKPSIPSNIFEQLKGEYKVRVAARNKAGRGSATEICVTGQSEKSVGLDITDLVIVCDEERQHCIYMEEFIYISNHDDAPKDCTTIRKCNQISLQNIRSRGREVNVTYHRTDTGGENWGAFPCAMYSYSQLDYQTLAVWCPTAAQHSGQLSDSCGGTFKKYVNTMAAAGNLRGIGGAKDLVTYCQNQPMFSEPNQQKFLAATVMRRTYYNITKSEVLDATILSRTVGKLDGISKLKQVFSTTQSGELLMRRRTCCCADCLSRNWDNCSLKEYVDKPKLIQLDVNDGPRITPPISDGLRGELEAEDGTEVLHPSNTEDSNEEEQLDDSDSSDMLVEENQFYAIWAKNQHGYSIVRCSAVSADIIQGLIVELADCPRRYYKFKVTNQVHEFQRNEIFAKVEVSGNSISKKTLENIIIFVSD